MNSRGRKIYSLLALALAGCVAGERHVSHVAKAWPSAQIKRVEVREVDGTINVHGGATDKVLLKAPLRAYGRVKVDTSHAAFEGARPVNDRQRRGIPSGFWSGWTEPRIDYD